MWCGAWVVMLAGLLMAFPGVAAESSLPSVDLGVREVDAGSLALISRHTDADWWALSRVGSEVGTGHPRKTLHVFRSSNAGRSWQEDVEATGAVAGGATPEILRTGRRPTRKSISSSG
ncbi:hypothetical protein DRW03_35050 [Corallococcus sp. H22C18031201]|nr:hypothetical protein DRW03_35050 [Corallococcus sp. H22C18031201]